MKASVIFGTRPEFIKVAPVIWALKQQPDVEVHVCFTGQHKEMVLPLLDFLEVTIDHYPDIMEPNQTLGTITSKAMSALDAYIGDYQPDIVFVQGDTTTAMCAAMAAFYRRVKVAHIEAGLRTFNMYSPFPEEFNRQVISKVTTLHFAPTDISEANLLKEGIDRAVVFNTGNTVIDTLLFAKEKLSGGGVPATLQPVMEQVKDGQRIVLITGHRRENFGGGFEQICSAIRQLAISNADVQFIYPVHLNPNVQQPVHRLLSDITNVHLIPPVNYPDFVWLMNKSYLILTDSGGVQEEAPSLGKPVLIMRENTERMEAVNDGCAKLIGVNADSIVRSVEELLNNAATYQAMSEVKNPFGDGTAAKQIVAQSIAYLSAS